jgi:hypothetical protein
MRTCMACVAVGGVVLASLVSVRADCPSGELFVHHDGSFESAYTWVGYGFSAPYGCFGEGYDLGPGVVNCAAYWITRGELSFGGCRWDLYIWEGGVSRQPGAVIASFPGVVFQNTPPWPYVGQNDYEMNVRVEDEFTIGHWDTGQWDSWVYIAADCDGLGGHPWNCVPPEYEWPSGWPSAWQHPSLIWGTTRSLGIGVYFTHDVTPTEATTWGAVKALFR